jgi:hypothetical protein
VYSWTQDSAPGLPELLLPQPFPQEERLAGESGFPTLRGQCLRFCNDVKLYAQLVFHLHRPATDADGFDSEVPLFQLG